LWLAAIPTGAITSFVIFGDPTTRKNAPAVPYAALWGVLSAVAMSLIWNYATTKKLAETAETLQATIKAERQAIIEAQTQNRKLEENNKAVKERLENLKQSVNLLGGSVANMAAVEKKLNEIFVQQELSQEKRRKLNQEQTQFLKKQEEDTLDREKGAIKQRIKDQCEEADKDHDGIIGSGSEVDKMKGFLSQLGIQWSDSFDKDGDGQIQIYEVMESLDKILDSYFTNLKDELSKKASLQKELYETNFQIGLAKRK
jgi:small-conductance mechanosensitive channel